MKKIKVRPAYIDRCKNYMHWLGNDLFPIDRSLPDHADGDYSAVEAMSAFESRGEEISCKEPYLLDCLKKGKQCREFLIKGWLSMTRSGEAQPEEFYGCAGLRSAEEFRSIFGRSPSLQYLLSTQAAMALQIATYESMLTQSSGKASIFLGQSLKPARAGN